MSETEPKHEYGVADRLAWPEGPGRDAGEGVVEELLPPTAADRRPRYRLRVFRDGLQSDDEIVLPDGLVTRVPGWERNMERDERLRFHGGQAAGWTEPIPGE